MSKLVKPSFPQLNRSHPLAQGLVFDMPFFEGSGLRAAELISQSDGALTNTPTWVNSIFGNALKITGTLGSQLVAATAKPHQQGLTQISVEFFVKGEANDSRVIDKRGASFRFGAFWKTFGGFTDGIVFFAGWSGGVAEWRSPQNVAPVNMWNHVVITYDFGSTSNDPKMYINGNEVTVSEITAPSGSANADGSNITIGNRPAANDGNTHSTLYARFWNRLLSRNEAAQLYANPFQIYKRKTLSAELSAYATAAPATRFNIMGTVGM